MSKKHKSLKKFNPLKDWCKTGSRGKEESKGGFEFVFGTRSSKEAGSKDEGDCEVEGEDGIGDLGGEVGGEVDEERNLNEGKDEGKDVTKKN